MGIRRWASGAGRARALGALLTLAAACASDQRPGVASSRYLFPVREYALPSGLRIVIEQDERTPIAGAVLVVEAGEIDDPPGKAGLAHTAEHLFFRAPTDGGASLWKTMRRFGASQFNAQTGLEQTTYHGFVPRNELDDLVGALMARMADPARGIDDAKVAKELLIVAEELRMRQDMMAGSRALTAILPLSDPTIRVTARRNQLDALTLTDVRAFAERFYRPERMTLVISGAIGADWDARLQAMLPPTLRGRDDERRPPVRRSVAAVPAAVLPTAVSMPTLKTSVVGPELWMAWPLPPAPGLQGVALEVMANVAERIVTNRLDSAPSALLSVEMSVLQNSRASAFVCRARLRSGADAERARGDVAKALEVLTLAGAPLGRGAVATAALRAVREETLATAIRMEGLQTRALTRARIVHDGAGAQVSELLKTIQSVDVFDVARFADTYLKLEAARAVLLLPDDTPARSSVAANGRLRPASLPPQVGSAGEPDIHDDDDDSAESTGASFAALAPAPRANGARVTTLANGLTVIVLRRPGLPFVSMLLGFHGDPQPGEPAGIRAALPQTSTWQWQGDPIDRGVFHRTTLEPDSYRETLDLFAADTDQALNLIHAQPAQLHVQWPSARFDRWLAAAAQTEAHPTTRASRAFRTALLGDHRYQLAPAVDAVRTVNGGDLQTWLEHTRRPNNGALIIVGNVDVDEVTRRVEWLLSGWWGEKTPVAAPPAPPRAPPAGSRPSPQILFTQDTARRSTELRFGCLLPPIGTFAADLRSDALAALLHDDLLRALRLKLGASYAPRVAALTLRGGTAYIGGVLDVEDAALPEAMDQLRKWLDPSRPFPVTLAAFDRERWNLARRNAFQGSTNGRTANDLFRAWNLGWPLAALDDVPNALAAMTMSDVAADLAACRASAVISVLGSRAP